MSEHSKYGRQKHRQPGSYKGIGLRIPVSVHARVEKLQSQLRVIQLIPLQRNNLSISQIMQPQE
ncbi:hypothetical protein D3C81_2296100 [compost metagenome]